MIIALDARPLTNRQVSGVEQHARNVVTQWAALAAATDPQNPPPQFRLLCDKSQSSSKELYDVSFIESLPSIFQPIFISGFNLLPRWYMGSRMLDALSRALRNEKIDVYHSFTPLVPRTAVCPVVQTIHDLAFELDPNVRQRPESRQRRRWTRLGAAWAHRIIAVSSQTKNDIESLYQVAPEKVSVVYNGINPVFQPKADPALRAKLRHRYNLPSSYVLAVGSDIPRRNYARMLDAMRMVWAVDPNTRLVVAGRNPWPESDLYRRAQAAGVLSHIVFVDAPADVELAEWYRGADLTCCASSFEGFGLSVLESMACGTPATCSDMRSLREVADDAAVYFPHDDPLAMGESLVGLLEDAEYRRQLKYRGLRRATLFTWETAAQLILETLQSVALGG